MYKIGAPRNVLAAMELSQPAFTSGLPDIPVLSETLLQMEFEIDERPAHLARVAHVILSDLGATIQVMRLAGREYAGNAGRIEDCVAALGLQACLDTMSKRTIARSHRHSAIVEVWEHARVIADISAVIANQTDFNIAPEDASLAGLCHDIGRLPRLLGWDFPNQLPSDIDLAALSIAAKFSLPLCVEEYFAGRHFGRMNNKWIAIVGWAHEVAEDPAIFLPDLESAAGLQAV